MQIAFLIAYMVILGLDMYSQHITRKSNREVLKQVEALVDTGDKKSTAQDNVLWKSIMILAKEINKLEDKNRV